MACYYLRKNKNDYIFGHILKDLYFNIFLSCSLIRKFIRKNKENNVRNIDFKS